MFYYFLFLSTKQTDCLFLTFKLIFDFFLFPDWGAEILFWSWTHSFTQESLSLLSQMSLGLVGLNAAIIIPHNSPF